ncbi:MAG: alpha/beta hydrolase [Spiroplasma sp.]
MKNTNINLLKLRKNVDIDSIEMFHACLVYNIKFQPLIEKELEKWPMYLDYWHSLVKNNNITNFKVKTTIDNLTIVGDYITTPIKNHNNNKVIFLLHGITNTRYWIFKQVYIFLEAGYNVVWYDARNHGESDAAPTTFGKKESHDLQDVINFICEKYHPKNIIIYGFSLGSASIIMWSELYSKFPNNKNIKLLICDSTFAELEQAYIDKINDYTLVPTKFMVNLFRTTIKKTTGIGDLTELQPIKYLKNIPKLPIIFLHGKNDSFINYTNSEELYNEKIRYEQSIKSKIFIIDKAMHGQSFLVGDNGVTIYDEFNQEHNKKISKLILDYINQQLN